VSTLGYIVLSLVVLLVSWQLFRRVAGSLSLSHLNMVSFTFYYSLLAQSFIGVNIAIHWLENHYLINKIRDFGVRQNAYFAVLYVLIAMPLAMMITYVLWGSRPQPLLKKYFEKPIQPAVSPKDSFVFYPFLLLMSLSIVAILYTFYKLGTVPLLLAFRGVSVEKMNIARVTAYREFPGNVYIRNIVAVGLPPILSYIALAYYFMYKNWRWRIISFILFLCAVVMTVYDLSKAPLINYLIGLVFLLIYTNKITGRQVFLSGIALSFLIVIMYIVLGRLPDMSLLFSWNTGPVGRIVLGQITSLFFHFRIFPALHPFLRGASFPNFLLRLLGSPLEHKTSARLVMEVVNPAGVAAGTAGVMNTLFVAEAYANWGWVGLVIAPLWVGFLIQSLYIHFLKARKTPFNLGVFAFLSYKIPAMVTGGFIDFVYSPGMLLIVALAVSPYVGGLLSKAMLWRSLRRAQ
jgi:oligosaccharide repeat unit polymerase